MRFASLLDSSKGGADRLLERGFVLGHKAAHAVELFNPPSMASRHAGCEAAFLSVEQILELIHGAYPQIGGLPSSCCAPGTGATQGRRRPTNNSMTGWNHSLRSMPPAFTNIRSGVTSGSVVSGDPQRGQYRRATWRPLEPISSKTAVSPSIFIVERLMMMMVEKALPDCGRQRSQWQRPAAIGAAEIL
jgi:hypothetical protein